MALATTHHPLDRVKDAGRFVNDNPNHPESHFLLARLCLEAGLTGEARRHAEAARAAGLNQRRLWLLFAELETRERGDTEAGRIAQNEALRHAASADPDPVWRCEACGTAQPRWVAACPSCHVPGQVRWGTTRPVAYLPPVPGKLLEFG